MYCDATIALDMLNTDLGLFASDYGTVSVAAILATVDDIGRHLTPGNRRSLQRVALDAAVAARDMYAADRMRREVGDSDALEYEFELAARAASEARWHLEHLIAVAFCVDDCPVEH